MGYEFIVYFEVLKGLGPATMEKQIPIFYDDVEDDTPEYQVEQWAVAEARQELKNAGFQHIVFQEIHQI